MRQCHNEGMSKITQYTAQQIIDLFVGGTKTKELSERFGIWTTSISNLLRGDTWTQCRRPSNILELIKEQANIGMFKKGEQRYIDAPPLTDTQMDIVIGSLLGDSWISKETRDGSNCRFFKRQSKDRFDYVQWMNNQLMPYSNRVKQIHSSEKLIGDKHYKIIERRAVPKHLVGCELDTHAHPHFTFLRRQWYNYSTKIIPDDLILNPLRIAIWYFDDGSNSEKQRHAVLCTQSFSMEEAAFLCGKLSDFDMRPSITKRWSEYQQCYMPILKFSRQSYDNLIKLVTPYMLWDCFAHKIKWHAKTPQHLQNQVKLTEEKVRKIIEMRRQNIPAADIASEFGIHKNHVWAIARVAMWGHLK